MGQFKSKVKSKFHYEKVDTKFEPGCIVLAPKLNQNFRQLWDEERAELKKHLKVPKRDEGFEHDEIIGGCDVSYSTKDPTKACVAIVVYDRKGCCNGLGRIVYTKEKIVDNTLPYIPGYLGFKEVPLLVEMIKAVPKLWRPDFWMVDGNGILHPDRFGSACHLGVVCDIPTIGVAKTLHAFEGITQEGNDIKCDGELLGRAVDTTPGSIKSVFVSTGHKVPLDVAERMVLYCSRFRIPEPIRNADINSRAALRQVGL